MYCANCGTNIYESDSFCRYCGNRVERQSPEETIAAEPQASFDEDYSVQQKETFQASFDEPLPEDEPIIVEDHSSEPEFIQAPGESPRFVQEIKPAQDFVQTVPVSGSLKTSDAASVLGGASALGAASASNTAAYYYGPESYENNNAAIGISDRAGHSAKPTPRSAPKVFFGKAAFVFCVSIIGALSVTCGVLIGIVYNLL